jgi:hypothetical protein
LAVVNLLHIEHRPPARIHNENCVHRLTFVPRPPECSLH